MADLKMTDDGDIQIDGGSLSLVTGVDGIRQDLIQKLRTFLGEWFLDLSDGVSYYQNILIKNPSPQVVESLLQDRILSTPGVIEILSFNLDYDPVLRKLTGAFEVRSEEGIINYDLLNIG